MKKNVLVLFGGRSAEHEVSIITALQFAERIDSEKYVVHLCYITRDNRFFVGENLKSFDSFRKFDESKFIEVVLLPNDKHLYARRRKKLRELFEVFFAFNCCHGGMGENGVLSALLSLSNIPSSASSHTALGIAMDKVLTKKLLEADIPVVPYIVVNSRMWESSRELTVNAVKIFGFPVVVKPARQGSSIGVSLARNEDELLHAARIAFEYDCKLIIERAIINKREFNCSCIGSEDEPLISEVEEPESSSVILSFGEKYGGGGKGKGVVLKSQPRGMESLERKFPAEISKKLSTMIKNFSRKCFMILELSGVVRVDFIFDTKEEKLYLSEVNTIPGSLSTYFWSKLELADTLISGAFSESEKLKKLKNDYIISLF